MKRTALAMAIALAGCGSAESAPIELKSDSLVPDAALSGLVSGQPFTSAHAVALAGPPGRGDVKFVNVTAEPIACDAAHTTPTILQVMVVWSAGEAYDLGDGLFGTIVHDVGGVTTVSVTDVGRVEVDSAPAAVGAVGRVGLRLDVDDENHVEGRIDVVLCE